jgi:hypothetical protein
MRRAHHPPIAVAISSIANHSAFPALIILGELSAEIDVSAPHASISRSTMPTIKHATPDNSGISPPVLPSVSRRRFLIGGAGIAAAASLPAAAEAASSEQANASTPTQPKENAP